MLTTRSTDISSHEPLPDLHPHDRLLLRSLATITKPELADNKASFLLTDKKDHHGNIKAQAIKTDAVSRPMPAKRKNIQDQTFDIPAHIEKGSPEYFKAIIQHTFDVTRDNLRKDLSDIKHPTKKGLTCVSSVPILPDFSTMTDMGGYATIKYANNPVKASNKYDVRLDAAILVNDENDPSRLRDYKAAAARYLKSPEDYPPPNPLQDWHLYIPDTVDDAAGLKAKALAMVNGEDDDEDSFYTTTNADGKKVFKFKHVREYETAQTEAIPSLKEAWSKELALIVRDGDDQKPHGAFIYPVVAKSVIRPMRSKNISMVSRQRFGRGEEIVPICPTMHFTLAKETEEDKAESYRTKYKADPLGVFVEVEEAQRIAEEEAAAARDTEMKDHTDAEADADGEADADADANADAEGEEDVEMGM